MRLNFFIMTGFMALLASATNVNVRMPLASGESKELENDPGTIFQRESDLSFEKKATISVKVYVHIVSVDKTPSGGNVPVRY